MMKDQNNRMSNENQPYSDHAADRGEPSYVWRAGQERRYSMILAAAETRAQGMILENGCGVGMYLSRLAPNARFAVGIEVERPRGVEALAITDRDRGAVLNAVGEHLPFENDSFDLILSHEVVEHVQDDRLYTHEMVRTLKPGGRIVLFCPNRWYPYETHGIYRNGKYEFGNKLFVNYLPRFLRDRLCPHVNVYTRRDLENLFRGVPVRFVKRTVIFGAYDNIIARTGAAGVILRAILQALEKTPLRIFGLSHFWVIEKTEKPA